MTSADASTTDIALTIPGTWNARDAGSLTGLTRGVLVRSAALMNLTDDGRAELARLGISDVVDLRSPHEVAANGPDAVDGPGTTRPVAVHRLPISPGSAVPESGEIDPDVMAQLFARLQEPGFAENLLTSVYVEMVTAPAWVAQLGRALEVIARADGATLVHCSAGKDRTGVLCALSAHLAGADVEAIDADFLYSNHALADQVTIVPAAVPQEALEVIKPLLGVHLVSLQAMRSALDSTYGGLHGFLDAAGVGPAVAGLPRERLGAPS
ncbi:tyrosine-protein phosphatase [Salana multivorans]|uniref:tyrosine-protein phosphatase n=1 Tax=Salana multivorans TaxID=120377 RepID=UPI0024938391|nr:tyrosine-protein phosphatase [Salana multivorans]